MLLGLIQMPYEKLVRVKKTKMEQAMEVFLLRLNTITNRLKLLIFMCKSPNLPIVFCYGVRNVRLSHQTYFLDLFNLLYISGFESGTSRMDDRHCNRERLQRWQFWLKMNKVQAVADVHHPQRWRTILRTLKHISHMFQYPMCRMYNYSR